MLGDNGRDNSKKRKILWHSDSVVERQNNSNFNITDETPFYSQPQTNRTAVKIAALNDQIEDQKKEISHWRAQFEKQQQQAAQIAQNFSAELERVRLERNNLKAQVATLTTQLAKKQSENTNHLTEITKLNLKLSTLETTVALYETHCAFMTEVETPVFDAMSPGLHYQYQPQEETNNNGQEQEAPIIIPAVKRSKKI